MIPNFQTPPLATTSVFSESVSLLLFLRFICVALDCTRKWYHVIFVFLCLTSLSMIISSASMLLQMVFFIFYGQVIFHCIYITSSLSIFYKWQMVVIKIFSSVQSLSRVRLFATPWIAARQASLSITNSQSSHRLMSIESVMPSSHLILCRPLLLLSPIRPSIRVFSYTVSNSCVHILQTNIQKWTCWVVW